MPLTPLELSRLPKDINPADYVALDVEPTLSDRHPITGATVQAPGGTMEVIIIPFLVTIPLACLHHSDVLDGKGRKANPLDGMVPILGGARFVLPRARLVDKLLEMIDAQEALDAAALPPVEAEAPPLPLLSSEERPTLRLIEDECPST